MKHTNLWNELELEQPKDRSNLYIGIALGIIITACAGILGLGLLAEMLSK